VTDRSLETAFELDRRWHWLRGDMERSKQPDLAALAAVLAARGVDYAIIGGVALQVHQDEPRTTLDIDVVVLARTAIPGDALRAAGFQELGRHEHSDNWVAPGGTPVQFTDDPALAAGIGRAIEVRVRDISLRVLSAADLLHAKLRAGADAARRRSKRLQDLADAQALLEQDPGLEAELTADARALLSRLPR
jgi:hypothetical protein